MTHQEYPNRPVVLGEVGELENSNKIFYLPNDHVEIAIPGKGNLIVPPENQFPRVKHTIEGLVDDLAPGSDLANRLQTEVLELFVEAFCKNPERPAFGTLVFYPRRKDLVWYAPPEWHQISLLTRNSLLIRDPQQTIDWQNQRELFRPTVVGFGGASVGKNAFERVIYTLGPQDAKIADPRAYKDTNSARTHLNYWEIGENKAQVAAEQIHNNNPFMNLHVYEEGLHPANINEFLKGNSKTGEPALDYLIEETDDPDAKINLRLQARQHRIPVLMVTDIGVAHQIDIRNFRDNPSASLAVGVSDEQLLTAQDEWHKDRANRELFFKFAFALIGDNWKEVPEFRDIILKNLITPFAGGIPQLGNAAVGGGADIATLIAMDRLGYELPQRTFYDPRRNFGEHLNNS